MDRLDLTAQFVRHWWPVRLVLGVDVVTKGLALGIKHNRNIAVAVTLEQSPDHINHTLDRSGWLAAAAHQWGQGVKGPKQIGRAIHQHQFIRVCHFMLSCKLGFVWELIESFLLIN